MIGEKPSESEVLLSLTPAEFIGLVNSAWHGVVMCYGDYDAFITASDIITTKGIMEVATRLFNRDALIEAWCAIHAGHPEPQDMLRKLVVEKVDVWYAAIDFTNAEERKARGDS